MNSPRPVARTPLREATALAPGVDALTGWLEPLRPALPLGEGEWTVLTEFQADLTRLIAPRPIGPGVPPAERTARLVKLRRQLVHRHGLEQPQGPTGAVVQALNQFLCGFIDTDLRDATGPGHGRMILRHAKPAIARSWQQRLQFGGLVGIAATERHGGSRIQEITTRARQDGTGTGWLVSGEKCWVSRLEEASAFVLFFKDAHERITAAVVDQCASGVRRVPVEPVGLSGWTWGTLELDDVAIGEDDLLGAPGEGMEIFHRHFDHYRPLVAATALGTGAAVHSTVAATLTGRLAAGTLPRVRDTALVALARHHIALTSALTGTLAAVSIAAAAELTGTGRGEANLITRTIKAHAVDTAYLAATELPLLIGASGYQADHPMAKARADINGLQYADGIHDSLYRSAGRLLTTPAPADGSAALGGSA